MLASRLISTLCLLDYWYAVLRTELMEITDENTEDRDDSTFDNQETPMEHVVEDLEDVGLQEKESSEIHSRDSKTLEHDLPDNTIGDAEDDDASSEESNNGTIFRKSEPLNETDITEVKWLLDALAANVIFRRCKMTKIQAAAARKLFEELSGSDLVR